MNNIAFQLEAVIVQKVKTIDFYSIKLTYYQQRYTVTYMELLIIIETLKKSKTILLGQKLSINTDNKTPKCKNFNTNRVLRWILILEDFGTGIEYIKGEENIVSYAL